MAKLDASKMTAKMLARSAQAGQDWLDGVSNPSRDPVQAAIKAAPKWEAKMQEAITKKKWQKKMAKVNAADIVAAAQKAGTSAYTTGIQNRAEKIARVHQDLVPRILANQAKVQAMPDVTDADREARMVANMRGMKQIGVDRAGT